MQTTNKDYNLIIFTLWRRYLRMFSNLNIGRIKSRLKLTQGLICSQMSQLEALHGICGKTYKEQAVWFLNCFWDEFSGEAERLWQYVLKNEELDLESHSEGSGLDEMKAHVFLEKFDQTLTVRDMRDKLRSTGAIGQTERPKTVPLTHYLLYKYNVDWKTLTDVTRQGDNKEEMAKAERLLAEVQAAFQESEAKAAAARKALVEAQNAEAAATQRENEAKQREAEAVQSENAAKAREAEAVQSEADAKAAEERAVNAENAAKQREAEAVASEEAAKQRESEAKASEEQAKQRETAAKASAAEAAQKEAAAQNDAQTAQVAANAAKEAQSELEAALAELKAQEDAFNAKKNQLEATGNDESIGIVSRNKAKAELAQLLAEDPLPLRRAKITVEAAIRKAEKATQVAAETASAAASSAAESSKARGLADQDSNAASQARKQAEQAAADASRAREAASQARENASKAREAASSKRKCNSN